VPADQRVGRSVGEERPVVSAAPESAASGAFRALGASVRSCERV
jgi:septum site-determining protein MinD